MERHCLGLSTKRLSFHEKITLAESAFKQPEGLNSEELRESFEGSRGSKAFRRWTKRKDELHKK